MEPEKKKHAGGRPRIWTLPKSMSLGSEIEKWMYADTTRMFPIEYLLLPESQAKGLHIDLPTTLAEKHQEFKLLWDRINALAEHRISKEALTGKINAQFAQFYLERKGTNTLRTLEETPESTE